MNGSGAKPKAEHGFQNKTNRKHRRSSSELASSISLGDQSMEKWITYKGKWERSPSEQRSLGDQSMETRIIFKRTDPARPQTVDLNQDLDQVFKTLDQTISLFVREELNRLRSVLISASVKVQPGPVQVSPVQVGDFLSHSQAFLNTTLSLLRQMGRGDLAESLHNQTVSVVCEQQLKSHLKNRFSQVFEGVPKAGSPASLQQIYTELHVVEGGASAAANQEHEFRHTGSSGKPAGGAVAMADIFTRHSESGPAAVRVVLTKGVAGVGKTVLTQKFSLDWAEGRGQWDVQLLLPLTFRQLNVVKDRSWSLVELLHHFFSQTQHLQHFEGIQLLFILDGLDECRLPLDFVGSQSLTSDLASTSVGELLVNLIRGDLLPSARLWITTRPAAANQIPAEYVSVVTEVLGFSDLQKEQFFRRRLRDGGCASALVSHIRSVRCLYAMCYIPVFCWMLSVVLENLGEQLPHTLTQTYAHFLVVEAKVSDIKYGQATGADSPWSPEIRDMVRCLGRLAFEQLQRGNLIFYESDLSQSGLNGPEAARCSGVFTQVFLEEQGLYQDKVYCFVHLSVQEFLAALHVHQTFTESGQNLLQHPGWNRRPMALVSPQAALLRFYRSAVDRALQSPNGHLDMFLRFLLGLSLPANQRLLRGLLTAPRRTPRIHERLIRLLREELAQKPLEKTMNLFHCLKELQDPTLSSKVQAFLMSGRLEAQSLSPAQWTTLTFLLLSSEEHLQEFHLRRFGSSEEALLNLLPVVSNSHRAVLSGCGVSWRGCKALSSLLLSPTSALRDLDLSDNDLNDCEVQLLSYGLSDPQCPLQALRLCGCGVSSEGCAALASALVSNPHHITQLDLSFNHPGEQGRQLLMERLHDPQCSLTTLRFDHCEALRLTTGPRKFYCVLTLDPLTAFRKLSLSVDCRSAVAGRALQAYPAHPMRFDSCAQLLCDAALPPWAYWEVVWTGVVHIAVAHRDIRRHGNHRDCRFGMNKSSWCLSCSQSGCTAWHDGAHHDLGGALLQGSDLGQTVRVGVLLDALGGALSFFRVSAEGHALLHRFNAVFTEPLLAGFGFGLNLGFGLNSASDSVTLVEPRPRTGPETGSWSTHRLDLV